MKDLNSIIRRNPALWLIMLIASTQLACLAGPQPVRPVPKRGSCPSNYSSWDSYCIPNRSATGVIDRIGAYCPSGFEGSGEYCVAYPKGREAIIKIGYSCPPDWDSSGNYCLSPSAR
jgi:hypothetical protein